MAFQIFLFVTISARTHLHAHFCHPQGLECKLRHIYALKVEILPTKINITQDTFVSRTTNQSQNEKSYSHFFFLAQKSSWEYLALKCFKVKHIVVTCKTFGVKQMTVRDKSVYSTGERNGHYVFKVLVHTPFLQI